MSEPVGEDKEPLSMYKAVSRAMSEEQEKVDKSDAKRRQNQHIIIYLFVSCVICFSFLLGIWQFSFFWIFGLVGLTFLVWRGKVLSLNEESVRQMEIQVQRRRALRQNETAEWFNFIFNRWWVFSETSISDSIKKRLDPLLMQIKPCFLNSLEVDSFSFGNKTPFIKYLQVYDCTEGGKKAMTWSTVHQPPSGLKRAPQFQMLIEAQVELSGDDFLMELAARFGKKWIGLSLNVAIEKLNISGKIQMNVRIDMDTPFPHVSSVTVCFVEKPKVWFAVRFLRQIQIMEIPILRMWIHSLVTNAFCEALVNPEKLEIDLRPPSMSSDYLLLCNPLAKPSAAIGVLTILINAEYKAADKKDKSDVENNPLELIEDQRFCSVSLGKQELSSPMFLGLSPWKHAANFLVYNLKTDLLNIQLKSKFLLTNKTLLLYEKPLSGYPFDQKQSLDGKPIKKKKVPTATLR